MPSLARFHEFTIWLKTANRPQVAVATLNWLYRARARRNVAKTFLGLRIHDGTTELVRGYLAEMQLFLSYSAAEAMGDAVGK